VILVNKNREKQSMSK